MIISRDFLRGIKFSVMTDNDRMGFAGAMSPVALIGENDQYLVVIDGNYCEVYSAEAMEDGTFEPIETNDNICELPY